MRVFVFFKQKTAYEMRIIDWSSDVCSSDLLIAGAVSRGLVKLDGNGQVVPDMATSWRVSDDGRSIIFRLREAEWTDGRDVTGQDFVRMFRAVMARDSKHPFKQILSVIENGADVAAGKKPPNALGVLAPIPAVVEIRLRDRKSN